MLFIRVTRTQIIFSVQNFDEKMKHHCHFLIYNPDDPERNVSTLIPAESIRIPPERILGPDKSFQINIQSIFPDLGADQPISKIGLIFFADKHGSLTKEYNMELRMSLLLQIGN